MRCLLRNAGAMFAMLWSGAAAAVAGPVSIRTSDASFGSAFDPAAIVQPQWQPVSDLEPLIELSLHLREVGETWFPHSPALHSTVLIAPVPAQRPAAVLIPLPAPLWIGVTGLGCIALVARVINPCLRQWRALR